MLKVVFCGTPAFAVPSLRQLLAEPEFDVRAVVTQPDRRRGRGQEFSFSPVKEAALAAGILVFQPEKIKTDEVYEFFAAQAADAVVIIAYGRIIPERLLAIPRLGWINLHASLLPRYRGAAPIQWAIVNGETQTGLTTMRIDTGLDTGPILERREIEIAPDETAPELSPRMADAGAKLLASTLRRLARGEITPEPQNDALASLAPPLEKSDGRIQWALPAAQIYNRIRGLQPWPGAFTTFRSRSCHIWGKPDGHSTATLGTIENDAAEWYVVCGEGSRLRLEFAQIEGRKRTTAREFANGARLEPGERFE
jgi:methionyl-tRNA formyltransferase